MKKIILSILIPFVYLSSESGKIKKTAAETPKKDSCNRILGQGETFPEKRL